MEESKSSVTRWLRVAPWVLAASVVGMLLVGRGQEPALAGAPPAYELVELPAGLDTLSSLGDAAERVAACAPECTEVLYVWTPRMPLSRSAIPQVAEAARQLGVGLTLLGFEELERYAERDGATADDGSGPLADALLAEGALTHAPSLVVHDGSRALGPAILGYKTAEAYEAMIARRLERPLAADAPVAPIGADAADVSLAPLALPDERAVAARTVSDVPAVGVPGAYFKWVPGTRMLAYESGRRVYLVNLDDGRSRPAPGTIDFVPTPDGRYFVTPGPQNTGLAFFDADEVLAASASGQGEAVPPFYLDDRMRDQYPSVGILEEGDGRVRYRILTSWFEGVVYRDYEVVDDGTARPEVRSLGAPVVPCRGTELSTPIISQDGSEVAARDEASGTTKIFRFLDDGSCEVAVALGTPTRKVAWHASGRLLAFSTPRVRTRDSGGIEPGIFIYDRDRRTVTRVADSDGASQLAFPDFVGDDAVVFLIPNRQWSVFRVVQPLP